jgi:hypothetical protein
MYTPITEEELVLITTYIALAIIPYIIGRYIETTDRDIGEEISTLNIINFRKMIFKSTPTSILRPTGGRVADYIEEIKKNILKGYRGRELTRDLEIPKDISPLLNMICEDNVETTEEASHILSNNYKIILKERLKNLDISLTILTIAYIFSPLLGLILYSIIGDPVYSIGILTLQITISEILIRRRIK